MLVKNKIVLISGASSGIGALTAQRLAARGAVPVLTGRSKQKLEQAAAAITGEKAVYTMDVTDMAQVEQTVQAVAARYGRIDILLNNAGFGYFESFMEASTQSFEDMMNTNYMGMVRLTKLVLPYMLEQKGGQIVNVASMAGKLATPKSTAYSASKHAVLGFTNALRMELKGSGVKVASVNPGPIDTPFFEQADPEGTYVKNISWFIMKPEVVADAIVRVMERHRDEVNLPKAAAAGMKLYQLMPRTADRLLGGLFNRK
ncbi:SDR family NAD(P)-dependent oxidoreductase [Paenibacillus protaetiae]|uniref:SDR family oxidoreductase n=1 Tax=Paenibacillus protaetiae TaxID=2509456 RepID=A0A4P6F1C1_9BACL|nr:SDR family oxidoreductase [Paenibacillus protaetiae]QAY68433.1 SDR family oxidoreductase [Paenibacillus protaetiae]